MCKPRISGPLSFRPINANVKENHAGKGDYGKCERFYSTQYSDKKEDGIQIGRPLIRKTFYAASSNTLGESESEKPEFEKADLLEKLKHPNIVEYVLIDPKHKTIIMEDTGFSLAEIRETVRFSFYEELYIFLKVLDGVQYLHDRDICHNDIYEGNITLKKDGTVKIIDFGSAEKTCPES
ncbi:MAG: hypothetical protein C5B47_03685 [Verrucomicrobia bacterium]|nr:MAG: hypothetical protein C5B47_03685 [Verrucomicrobiota bacterium]